MLNAEIKAVRYSKEFDRCSKYFSYEMSKRWSGATSIRGVFDERARLFILCLAVALGSKRDPETGEIGFSVNAFKRMASDTGLMSKGRAGALLGYLRLIGFLRSDVESGAGRRLILKSTNDLISYAAEGWRVSYRSASGLLPENRRLLISVTADERVIEFINFFVWRYLKGWRPFQELKLLNSFWKMRGGLPVLFHIHSSGATETISPLEISKRFSIPRTQANLIIRKGMEAGQVTRNDGRLSLGDHLKEELETAIARFFAMILAAAHEDLLEIME